MNGTDLTILSTADVAKRAGVHRDTLLRWLRVGLVQEPRRDRRGWRAFTLQEAERIASFSRTTPDGWPITDAIDRAEANPILASLRRIDWGFQGAKTSYLTHGLHPYPAKYIPQIPNALIQQLSSVGETVLDPFCGSGTTLVESLVLKRNAIGIDANPLACLISEAKTAKFEEGDASILLSLAQKAEHLADALSIPEEQQLFGEVFVSKAPRPTNSDLTFWFETFVIEELAEIGSWCCALPTGDSKKVALTAFSSIIVSVSKQDSDTRYVRREKNIRPGDTFRRFARATRDAVHTVTEFREIVEERFSCRILNSDILTAPNIPRVDLVVCSPPYPNAFSYHLYHRTRMVWLGMDSIKFKAEEIGSHRKYSKKGNDAATAETFRSEMMTVFQWLSSILETGRYACFVLGDSTIRGERVDNAQLVSEVAASCSFREVDRLRRKICDNKKSFNPAIGKIKDESILILQRL